MYIYIYIYIYIIIYIYIYTHICILTIFRLFLANYKVLSLSLSRMVDQSTKPIHFVCLSPHIHPSPPHPSPLRARDPPPLHARNPPLRVKRARDPIPHPLPMRKGPPYAQRTPLLLPTAWPFLRHVADIGTQKWSR